MAERPGTRAFRIVSVVAFAAAGLAVGLGLLSLAGVDVPRRVWLARELLLGPEPVGIWQDDPTLGWRHIPGAEGRQRVVPDFDVRYRIDEWGGRHIPERPSTGPAVLFLGGSFTFGHGVEDDETYPALLQTRWPDLRVFDFATNAWGTAQAVALLPELLDRDPDIALVVYGFITHHTKRNHLSATWLRQLDETRGRRNPYYAIEDGSLVYRGLADPQRDALPDDADQMRRELTMTSILLFELKRLCAERGIPLVVVHLPDGAGGTARKLLDVAVRAQNVIDLTRRLDYGSLRYEHDIHLTPAGHAAVADALDAPLRARLAEGGAAAHSPGDSP